MTYTEQEMTEHLKTEELGVLECFINELENLQKATARLQTKIKNGEEVNFLSESSDIFEIMQECNAILVGNMSYVRNIEADITKERIANIKAA